MTSPWEISTPEVYISAFGWVSCIVGVIAASLGCCVCCQCCRSLNGEPLVGNRWLGGEKVRNYMVSYGKFMVTKSLW